MIRWLQRLTTLAATSVVGVFAQSAAGPEKINEEVLPLPAIESLGVDFLVPSKREENKKKGKPSGAAAENPLLPSIAPQTGQMPLIPLFPPVDLPILPMSGAEVFPAPEMFRLPGLPDWFGGQVQAVLDEPKIAVREVRFVGNSVFSDRELRRVVQPFLDQGEVTNEGLEAMRGALTAHYLQHEYVTSGAVLPDQQIQGGVVIFRLVEGRLMRIQWNDHGRLRETYLNSQMSESLHGVLNMADVREQLQLLQRNPNIRQINAQLKPDIRPGEAYLDVIVPERRSVYGGVEIHNRRSPSIGSEQITTWLGTTNLTGFSDTLDLRIGLLQRGFGDPKFFNGNDMAVQYAIELPWWHTQVELYAQRINYAVIEDSLAPLNIDGSTESVRGTLRWRLLRNTKRELATGITLDYRHSRTELLGVPFSITPGAVNGEAEQTTLRWFQEYISRSRQHVLAIRNTLSMGMNGTHDGTGRDASFKSWQLNGQWIRRLGGGGAQVVLRGAAQWSDSPLLSLEQMSIGGSNTVRGVRENQLVRDWGGFISTEVRVPVWQREGGRTAVYLAPFVDYGAGWMLTQQPTGKWEPKDRQWVGSAGLGLLVQLSQRADAQLYWGRSFHRTQRSGDHDLQDNGIHFSIRWNGF